jgi:hypothetical protein
MTPRLVRRIACPRIPVVSSVGSGSLADILGRLHPLLRSLSRLAAESFLNSVQTGWLDEIIFWSDFHSFQPVSLAVLGSLPQIFPQIIGWNLLHNRFRYSPRLHSETGAKRQHPSMSGESKSGL